VRNSFELDGWLLKPLTNHFLAKLFDCGDDDLNEFFQVDLIPHEKHLLTKTYGLSIKDKGADPDALPIALISFCNDKIRLDNVRGVDLTGIRRPYTYLPAVKIVRLGVHKNYRRKGIGTHLLNMTKSFFLSENRTGCRVLTVDAYKTTDVTSFYQKSYFDFITNKDKRKKTRTMFYDLIRTKLS